MPVKRTITLAMTLSGAMCGLAGAILVFGSISHRMVTDGSLTGFTGSAGFNGIVVALFGGLNPLWTIVSGVLFGGLIGGGSAHPGSARACLRPGHSAQRHDRGPVVCVEYLRRRARAQRDGAGWPPGRRSTAAAAHRATRAAGGGGTP